MDERKYDFEYEYIDGVKWYKCTEAGCNHKTKRKYSDDESFTKYNEEEEYEYEDSHDEFFYNPKKENDIPVEFVPQVTVVDTKIPEINPWTRKKNNEDNR